MRKLLSTLIVLMAFVLCAFSVEKPAYDSSKAVKDTGNKAFNATSAIKTVADMKTGWNLGNTFDAINGKTLASETSWGQPKTTKAMIDGLAKSGIKTIRIPTSWSNHFVDTNYTIDPNWMARVKEVVDWAIDDGMYVILNTHHDNWGKNTTVPRCGGYYPTSANYEESSRYAVNVWAQISQAFNNGYDEHLVFETFNEPRLCGTNHEWWFDRNAADCKDAAKTLNQLNQDALDTIRASGGNNLKRFVACPGLQASPDSALEAAFVMPKDVEPGRLIVSVHMYAPYKFAMESPGTTKWNPGFERELTYQFNRLNNAFIQKGYAVYIGEYGATDKRNIEDRVTWFHAFLSNTKKLGIPCFLWDNGQIMGSSGSDYSEKYGYYNRTKQTWYFPEIIAAINEEMK